ncbi:hypothetical protein D3C76_1542160 [compost metagenome]
MRVDRAQFCTGTDDSGFARPYALSAEAAAERHPGKEPGSQNPAGRQREADHLFVGYFWSLRPGLAGIRGQWGEAFGTRHPQ